MQAPANLSENRLLATLNADERKRFLPNLKPVSLELAETGYRVEPPFTHVILPIGPPDIFLNRLEYRRRRTGRTNVPVS